MTKTIEERTIEILENPQKLDQTVDDEKTRTITKEALTAKSHQYGKIRRLFEG